MKAVNNTFLFVAFVILIAALPLPGGSSSDDWHEPLAKVRFRIEKDDDYALIPAISLLDVQPDKKSESVWKWIQKNRWKEKRRVNGRLCLNALPTFGSKPIIYNLHRNIGRFVARGTVTDGADPNTSVRFELKNDRRTLFRSGHVTVRNPVVQINVAIPPGSRQLKLVTLSDEKKYYRWARWVDPGFVLRRQYPQVSSTQLYAPGYDLEKFDPVIRVTADGSKVDSRILSVAKGEPMNVLFDTTESSPSYVVYLVPKNRARAMLPSWEPRAGLVLETKWSKKGFNSKDRLPEFSKRFDSTVDSVGRNLVDDIQHVFPVHRFPDYDGAEPSKKGGYGLYRYKGYFGVTKPRKYSFSTMSDWDSYLTVDDELVIGWPGKHNYRGGRRGQKQGTISLAPGVHKLEYYNYNRWGAMYCLAAWEKPGEELRPMTRTDFHAVGRYRAMMVETDDPAEPYFPFEWSTVDDFRVQQHGRSFVTMRFDALIPAGSDYSCRWGFDDGSTARGKTIEHVFLRQGLRKVQLEVLSENQALANSIHDVYVHYRWDTTLQDLNNADYYTEAIRTRSLDRVPADDLINLFVLADKAERPDWKGLATEALTKNVARLVQESDEVDFMFEFGKLLRSAKLREYEKALELFNGIAQKSTLGKSAADRAKVLRAEILVKYFGKYDQALKILGSNGTTGGSWRGDVGRRVVLTRARAMLGLGRAKEAAELIDGLAGAAGVPDQVKLQIKHSGLLRHAKLLAETQDDPNQWDHAAAMVETVVSEDPAKAFSPNVNLVTLDIHLAAGEFAAALYLAERLQHLQLNDYDRAEVLKRKVMASCGLKDLGRARSAYVILTKDYPRSPAISEAKQAIMQTFGND
jgi:hypothetical protein